MWFACVGRRPEKGQGRGGGSFAPGKGFKLPVPRSRNVAREGLGSKRGYRRSSSTRVLPPNGARTWCFHLYRIRWVCHFLPAPALLLGRNTVSLRREETLHARRQVP